MSAEANTDDQPDVPLEVEAQIMAESITEEGKTAGKEVTPEKTEEAEKEDNAPSAPEVEVETSQSDDDEEEEGDEEEEEVNKKYFIDKITELTGGYYDVTMKRTILNLVLFEADRCLKDRYEVLRPFQRKIALFDVCTDLVENIAFIPRRHKISIFYRTANGKILLNTELIWRRMRELQRDITKKILPELKPMLDERPKLSHEEVCDKYIESKFNTEGLKFVKVPEAWAVNHLPLFMVYKVYYRDGEVNPDLAGAADPNPYRVVPNKKPDVYPKEMFGIPMPTGDGEAGNGDGDGDNNMSEDEMQLPASRSAKGKRNKKETESVTGQYEEEIDLTVESPPPSPSKNNDEAQTRKAILQDIRTYLDLLKDFEGVIPTETLNARKVELFASLPAPLGSQKRKHSSSRNSSRSARGDNSRTRLV